LVLADPANLALLPAAPDDLQAVPIAVPDFDAEHLRRGHAIHFRCRIWLRQRKRTGTKTGRADFLRGKSWEAREFWFRELRTTELLIRLVWLHSAKIA
jgi:hypothetical protein